MIPQNHPTPGVIITCNLLKFYNLQAPQISLFLLLLLTKKVQEWLQCIWGPCRSWHHYLWEKVRAKGLWDYVRWHSNITQLVSPEWLQCILGGLQVMALLSVTKPKGFMTKPKDLWDYVRILSKITKTHES